ncbi:MAG: pentapeptide repeat-containing protein [Pelistega sp.]|nr:pentapeptide repeat-containing protein [Pelistega sp.]
MSRLSYKDSCLKLQPDYIEEGCILPMPDSMPRFDDGDEDEDEQLGFSLFRECIEEADFSHLTLCRTFFGRSEIVESTFHNTDLTESNMTWNDFIEVDFSHAVLVNCDMRASLYEEVNFARADLSGSDLRLSSFEECDFSEAIMQGTILTHKQGVDLELSPQQRAEIAWTSEEGEEPEGG